LNPWAPVDTLLVDKTGTLTRGEPRLTDLAAVEGVEEDEVLRLAASLERSSKHHIARAIVDAAQQRELSLASSSDFDSSTGAGISGSAVFRHGDIQHVGAVGHALDVDLVVTGEGGAVDHVPFQFFQLLLEDHVIGGGIQTTDALRRFRPHAAVDAVIQAVLVENRRNQGRATTLVLNMCAWYEDRPMVLPFEGERS